MAELDFKTPVIKEQEDAAIVAHNTRMGLVLFVLYFSLYGGFMVLSAFAPEVMGWPFIGGVNLAVVYGLTLIVSAIGFALVYLLLCRRSK